MWRRGRKYYEKIWPHCSDSAEGPPAVAVDATPAYHVWYDAPQNMASFFGPATLLRLRLVWMLRDPVAKFWSYFWELKAYGGDWDKVKFADWVAPKLARTTCPELQGELMIIDFKDALSTLKLRPEERRHVIAKGANDP